MDFKTILIIALLAYGVFWYLNPAQGKQTIDDTIHQVQSFVSGKMVGNQSANADQEFSPVCGDGVAYSNQDFALKAGAVNITSGSC